ncbi:unnamed protein product [Rhodiola kirilowii]
MNRTLLEKARCMSFSSGLKSSMWGEAVVTNAYLVNRSPCFAIDFKLPQEMWLDKRISIDHLSQFGCNAYYAKTSNGKLEHRAIKYVMLEYPSGVKGYKFLVVQPVGYKMFKSRSVTFNEKDYHFRTLLTSDLPVSGATTQAIISFIPSGYYMGILGDHEGGAASDDPPADSQESGGHMDLQTPPQVSLGNQEEGGSEAIGEGSSSPHQQTYGTWVLMPKPAGAKIICSKWVFRIKEGNNLDDPHRFKAMLCAKGFTQRDGIDYNEIFSPVVKHKTLRLLLAMTTVYDWHLQQIDVKTDFLHGNLNETIYMSPHVGFEDSSKTNHVCLLKKSIYGLKQPPRQWNIKFNKCMLSRGFVRSKFDTCLYLKRPKSGMCLYPFIYVNDILIMSNAKSEIEKIKKELSMNFDMKDLGTAKKILDINIIRDRPNKKIILSQAEYIDKVIRKFNMEHCKSIVGSVMYCMLCTRPDLAFAISVLSMFMSNPGENHWHAMKFLLKYLNDTKNFGLVYANYGQKF